MAARKGAESVDPRAAFVRRLHERIRMTEQLFAVYHLCRCLRKQEFTSMGTKRHALVTSIGRFRSTFFFIGFQGSLVVVLIMIIDGIVKNAIVSWVLLKDT